MRLKFKDFKRDLRLKFKDFKGRCTRLFLVADPPPDYSQNYSGILGAAQILIPLKGEQQMPTIRLDDPAASAVAHQNDS